MVISNLFYLVNSCKDTYIFLSFCLFVSSTWSTLAETLPPPRNPEKSFPALSLVSSHHQTEAVGAFDIGCDKKSQSLLITASQNHVCSSQNYCCSSQSPLILTSRNMTTSSPCRLPGHADRTKAESLMFITIVLLQM